MVSAWHKILCFLFGHQFDYEAMYYYWPICERCEKEFHENGCELSNFQNWGLIGWPIHKVIQSFKLRWHIYSFKMFFSRCKGCSKIITFRRIVGKRYCSEKCEREDVPF